MKWIQCPKCHHLVEEPDTTVPRCEDCGYDFGSSVSDSPAIILFKEGWYEHISKKPLYISSKRGLKDACQQHGVISKYLEDS